MSETSAFANYSNTVQRLSSSVDQEQPTKRQISNDAATFEQEFLIGAALHAKVKSTEKLVGLFKNSKSVQNAVGRTKEQIEDLARKGFENARREATKAAQALQDRVVPPAVGQPAVNPNTLKPLKKAAKREEKKRLKAQDDKDAAGEEVDNSAADLDAARTAEATAKGVSEQADADAVGSVSGQIKTDAAGAKDALTAATKNRIVQENRSAKAIRQNTAREQELAQQTSTAERAGADLKIATDAQDAAKAAADADDVQRGGADADAADAADAAKDAEEAARIAKLSKIEQDTKDVEEASAASDEADPLGFLITAGAAIATQLIGRKIKAHEMQTTGHDIPLSYTSTLGA